MGWYVLHVGPRTEKKVASVCQQNGIPCYLPLREETKVYQRRKVTVHKPLFPGYVFASLTGDTRIHVLRTNHIYRILPPLDEGRLVHEIEQIRLALAADPRLEAKSGIRKGRRVRIKGGVFVGIEGLVEQLRGKQQVRLQVEMVSQSVILDVDRDFLEILE